MKTIKYITSAIAAGAFLLAGVASANVVASFDTEVESTWFDFDDDADPDATIEWVSSGGNPDGFIRYREQAQGGDDFLVAKNPASGLLGDKSAYLDHYISYDWRLNNPGASGLNDAEGAPGSGNKWKPGPFLDDIKIVGGTGGNTVINYEIATSYHFETGDDWQTASIYIGIGGSEGTWTIGGVAATEAQILDVLSDIKEIRIRTEYMNGGSEIWDFDNIGFTIVPEPSTYALIFGGMVLGLVTFFRRKK